MLDATAFFRENIVKFCIKHYEKHNIYVIMYRIVKKNIQEEDQYNMFNKKGFKKAGLCIVTALVIMGTSGCNTKIKPNYGYNPTDHVELGQYKGIEYSVDEEGIEKDIINKRILSDQKDNITYQEITSRGAKEADKVTVDFSATINGLQVSGFSNNDYEIVDNILVPSMRNLYLDALNPFMGETITLKA